jgi:hypothetical protein
MIELGFVGNPLADALSEVSSENYTETITKKLPKLKRLDGKFGIVICSGK